MSDLSRPLPVVLMFGIMYRDKTLADKTISLLQQRYGELLDDGVVYDFSTHSPYYDSEMGSGISKKLIAMKTLIPRDKIVEIKQYAVDLEQQFSRDGKREVNIDPGLISEENFILSTGKNFTHRIYLRDGVFAEVTLIFVKGNKFRTLPWTYLDYTKEPAADWLLKTRSWLLQQRIKGEKNA